ncbi:GDP-mannose 4,6-dehydratase [Candidatus Uhrbacteria bacterium]|nr:GDP-mannose 4,6-dehydratase [Candidatus Uhrbacteria bacterium]
MAELTFEKKNVLVTGGAGFIGSHLCERLLKDSHVICVDSFINSNERNIDRLLQLPDFEFLRHDMTKPLELESFKELDRFKVKFQGIQEIYHLACPTSAKNFDQFKLQTLESNSAAAKNAAELGVKYKAKVVHASTSVVYGPRRPDKEKFKETDLGAIDQLSPRACYDEGKRFAETICATYEQVHKLDVKIARIFRTYGPRQRLFDGEMVPDFIVDALEGRDLVIYGDDNFKTSLVYVSDIVDGLIKLMSAPSGIGPVNLGNDEEWKLADVAAKIIQMTGSSSKIRFEPPLLFMTPLGLPDLSKAKETLGWFPLVKLDEGLKQSIDYTLAHKELLGIA